MKIFPSPTLPVRAASTIALTAPSRASSATTASIFCMVGLRLPGLQTVGRRILRETAIRKAVPSEPLIERIAVNPQARRGLRFDVSTLVVHAGNKPSFHSHD